MLQKCIEGSSPKRPLSVETVRKYVAERWLTEREGLLLRAVQFLGRFGRLGPSPARPPYVASPSGTRGSHRDAALAGLPLRRPTCPNTTSSISPKTTRPDDSMCSSQPPRCCGLE